MKPLGRRVSHDPRDHRYQAPRRLFAAQRTYKYWYERFSVDQTGDTCVANAMAHFLGASPRTHTLAALDAMRPDSYTASYWSRQSGERGFRGYVYDAAQRVDEWADTPPEGGTSVRAGFKAIQSLGLITDYTWLTTTLDPQARIDDVVATVLYESPVVIGVSWYNDMFYAASDGLIHATGGVAGGHSVVVDGVNVAKERARLQTWGEHLTISLADLERLLADDGEAAVASEA